MGRVARGLLVVVGAVLVAAGVSWIWLVARNILEFRQAGGILAALVFAGLPGITAAGTGLFLLRLAASRHPGSI